MKKTLLAAVAAVGATIGLIGPAMAQPYGPPPFARPGGWDIAGRIHWIQDRIIRGRDHGALDRREFDRVQHQLDSIRREDADFRFTHGGHLDDRVRIDLERRLDRLNDEIHWLRDIHELRPW